MNELGGIGIAVLLLGLTIICAVLGVTVTVGSFILLAKNRVAESRMSSEKKLALAIISLLIPAIFSVLLINFEGGDRLIFAASPFLWIAPLAAFLFGLIEATRGHDWKAATFTAIVGLALLSVPAGLFIWSHFAVRSG